MPSNLDVECGSWSTWGSLQTNVGLLVRAGGRTLFLCLEIQAEKLTAATKTRRQVRPGTGGGGLLITWACDLLWLSRSYFSRLSNTWSLLLLLDCGHWSCLDCSSFTISDPHIRAKKQISRGGPAHIHSRAANQASRRFHNHIQGLCYCLLLVGSSY